MKAAWRRARLREGDRKQGEGVQEEVAAKSRELLIPERTTEWRPAAHVTNSVAKAAYSSAKNMCSQSKHYDIVPVVSNQYSARSQTLPHRIQLEDRISPTTPHEAAQDVRVPTTLRRDV